MRLYPFTFDPILKERVWGDSRLKELYGKKVPAGVPIGESWEVSDRPGDVNIINNGALAGKDLHWLVEQHGQDLLGSAKPENGRFPLLLKILDAQQTLSLQVHPPASVAAKLGSEPKTEMWYIADASPGAELFVGLKRGVTREEFEQKIKTGTVADCFHRVRVRRGDAMFLPSGRVHAVGAGLVIFEIQQNSDTTYRVFDWNRVGLDGKPRTLHVRESLASIDFEDFEPGLVSSSSEQRGNHRYKRLVDDPLFKVDVVVSEKKCSLAMKEPKLRIVAVVEGSACVRDGANSVELSNGQFCLVPASLETTQLWLEAFATVLLVETGD